MTAVLHLFLLFNLHNLHLRISLKFIDNESRKENPVSGKFSHCSECFNVWHLPPPRKGFLSDFRFGMTDEVEGPGLSSSCLNLYRLKNLIKTYYSRNLHLLEKSPLGWRIHHLRLSCISFITFSFLHAIPHFNLLSPFFFFKLRKNRTWYRMNS